jgi:hypothetical protein
LFSSSSPWGHEYGTAARTLRRLWQTRPSRKLLRKSWCREPIQQRVDPAASVGVKKINSYDMSSIMQLCSYHSYVHMILTYIMFLIVSDYIAEIGYFVMFRIWVMSRLDQTSLQEVGNCADFKC